jgi:hypothetical protein
MKAVLRYGRITRNGRTVTDADGRTGNVLSLPPLCASDKTSGTRCVSGVPPALQNVSSGAARHPEFRTYEISLLFRSRAGFAKG